MRTLLLLGVERSDGRHVNDGNCRGLAAKHGKSTGSAGLHAVLISRR